MPSNNSSKSHTYNLRKTNQNLNKPKLPQSPKAASNNHKNVIKRNGSRGLPVGFSSYESVLYPTIPTNTTDNEDEQIEVVDDDIEVTLRKYVGTKDFDCNSDQVTSGTTDIDGKDDIEINDLTEKEHETITRQSMLSNKKSKAEIETSSSSSLTATTTMTSDVGENRNEVKKKKFKRSKTPHSACLPVSASNRRVLNNYRKRRRFGSNSELRKLTSHDYMSGLRLADAFCITSSDSSEDDEDEEEQVEHDVEYFKKIVNEKDKEKTEQFINHLFQKIRKRNNLRNNKRVKCPLTLKKRRQGSRERTKCNSNVSSSVIDTSSLMKTNHHCCCCSIKHFANAKKKPPTNKQSKEHSKISDNFILEIDNCYVEDEYPVAICRCRKHSTYDDRSLKELNELTNKSSGTTRNIFNQEDKLECFENDLVRNRLGMQVMLKNRKNMGEPTTPQMTDGSSSDNSEEHILNKLDGNDEIQLQRFLEKKMKNFSSEFLKFLHHLPLNIFDDVPVSKTAFQGNFDNYYKFMLLQSHHNLECGLETITEKKMRVLGNDLMNQKLENDVSRRFIGNYLRLDNHKQKELLYSLIQHSSPNMIQSVRDYVHHRLKMDLVGTAPTDLSLAILQYLPPSDIGRISIVSKRWHRLCTDPYLWKYKCEELNLPLKSPSVKICPIIKENEEMTKKKYFPPNPDLSDENPSRIIPVTIGEMNRRCRFWKRCCERDYKTNLNWISQQYPYPMSYLAHKNYVITCLQYEEPYVVSGSDDNTLTVWNCQTNKFVSKLTGHHGGVWSSQLKNRICVSGSTDRSLRVWNILTGRCYHVLNGHSSTVRCLAMNEAGNLVASGSRDSTVRIWDIVKGIQVGEFHGHESAVRCICYHGKYIVSGAYDFTVRVWTLEKYIVHVLQGHSNRVYSLQCEGNIIASGSLDTTIRIWCIIKGTCLFSLDGHQSLTSSMRIQDDILISGNADATIRIWSLKTGGCLHILGNGSNEARHRTAVTAVSFHRNYIVTSSDDGTVKLWNKETGEFIRDLIRLANCYNGGVVWRLKVKNDRLICAAGSRNNTEPTKLLSVDFNHYFSNEMQMPNVIPMEEDELCLKSEIYQELLKLPEVNPNP